MRFITASSTDRKWLFLVAAFFLLGSCKLSGEKDKKEMRKDQADWPVYGGNISGNRYSILNQIQINNVNRLEIAWSYNSEPGLTGIPATKIHSEMECQPIVVNGILFGTSPGLKLFALNAATGKKIWVFDPFNNINPRITTCRGVMYWENGSDKRILFTAGSSLYAINALTGIPIESFGVGGKIDLHEGLDIHYEVKNLYVAATSPGVIYKNILVLGSAVSESGDAAPGYVRGFDVMTGKLVWVFHTIPEPGEFGYDSWPKDDYKKIGAANNWSGMTLDESRGLVYLGTGSPAADFYGGERQGINLFSDCILALYAETGKLKWYYQTIHHDLWDRDIPCPPNLTSIIYQGKRKDILVQSTKDGLVYVLDRDSGTSFFPVEERKVPINGLPGEHPCPVQKFPLKPLPFSNQVFGDADITDISSGAHDFIKNIFDSTKHADKFLPPREKPALLYGYSGGAEWGGNAIDPDGIFYQNANNGLWKLQMESGSIHVKELKSVSKGESLYISHCSVCHGKNKKGNGADIPGLLNINVRLNESEISHIIQNGERRMPSFAQLDLSECRALVEFITDKQKQPVTQIKKSQKTVRGIDPKKNDFPYTPPYHAKIWTKVFDQQGYPGIKPPWGTLNAIDLKSGDYVWRVPLGEYPELTKKGIPATGTENYGGPLVTSGGLVFIAATRDEKIRAFDKKTGKILWEYTLPAAGFASPITYEVNGRQYIVIAAGGGRGLKSGASYIAFALPETK